MNVMWVMITVRAIVTSLDSVVAPVMVVCMQSKMIKNFGGMKKGRFDYVSNCGMYVYGR